MILEKVIDHAVDTPNNVAIVDDKRTLTYRELVYGSNLFVDLLNDLAPRAQFGDMVGQIIGVGKIAEIPAHIHRIIEQHGRGVACQG